MNGHTLVDDPTATNLPRRTCSVCGAGVLDSPGGHSYGSAMTTQCEAKTFIVRLWDGWDGEWMDVSEPLPYLEARELAGNNNAGRGGQLAGKREGNFNDGDYYAVFESDTKMVFSDGNSQTRGPNNRNS